MTPEGTAMLVLALSALLIGIGAYGMAGSRSLLRQLISAEVAFNGIILAALIILAGKPAFTTAIAILLITIVAGEIIVVVSILAGMYRYTKTFDSTVMEEEGV